MVQKTDRYSYADIETAVKEVAQQMLIRGETEVSREMLLKSIESIIPISTINQELVEEIERWGKERAVDVSKQ